MYKKLVGLLRWGSLGRYNTNMRREPKPHKGLTLLPTQNLKLIGLEVFYLI